MLVMTDLPIQKVLKKPDIVGRMVKWVVELSEFDIKYEPRGPIKGQIFTDFVVELSSEIVQSAGVIFAGCSRWMGRLTSWVAELESFWKDPTMC